METFHIDDGFCPMDLDTDGFWSVRFGGLAKSEVQVGLGYVAEYSLSAMTLLSCKG